MNFIRIHKDEQAVPLSLTMILHKYSSLWGADTAHSRMFRLSHNAESLRRMAIAQILKETAEFWTREADKKSEETAEQAFARETARKYWEPLKAKIQENPRYLKDALNPKIWKRPESSDTSRAAEETPYRQLRETIFRFLRLPSTQLQVGKILQQKLNSYVFNKMNGNERDEAYLDAVVEFMAGDEWEKGLQQFDPTTKRKNGLPMDLKDWVIFRVANFMANYLRKPDVRGQFIVPRMDPETGQQMKDENDKPIFDRVTDQNMLEFLAGDTASESAEEAALKDIPEEAGEAAEGEAKTPAKPWKRRKAPPLFALRPSLADYAQAVLPGTESASIAKAINHELETQKKELQALLEEHSAKMVAQQNRELAGDSESPEALEDAEKSREALIEIEMELKNLEKASQTVAPLEALMNRLQEEYAASKEGPDKTLAQAKLNRMQLDYAKAVRNIVQPALDSAKKSADTKRDRHKGITDTRDTQQRDVDTSLEQEKMSALLPHVFSVMQAGGQKGFRDPKIHSSLGAYLKGLDADAMSALSSSKEPENLSPAALFKRLLMEASMRREVRKVQTNSDRLKETTLDFMKELVDKEGTIYNAAREQLMPMLQEIEGRGDLPKTFGESDADISGLMRLGGYAQARAELFPDTPWQDLTDEQRAQISQHVYENLYSHGRRPFYGIKAPSGRIDPKPMIPRGQTNAEAFTTHMTGELARMGNRAKNFDARLKSTDILAPSTIPTVSEPSEQPMPKVDGPDREEKELSTVAARVNSLLRRATILERMGRYAEADREDQRLIALARGAR